MALVGRGFLRCLSITELKKYLSSFCRLFSSGFRRIFINELLLNSKSERRIVSDVFPPAGLRLKLSAPPPA
jgi:hypothetical protein